MGKPLDHVIAHFNLKTAFSLIAIKAALRGAKSATGWKEKGLFSVVLWLSCRVPDS